MAVAAKQESSSRPDRDSGGGGAVPGTPKTVGIRALKQNASAVVAEVATGQVITITDRGRPVAQLIPYVEDHIARLLASGRVRPATARFADLPPPAPALPGERSLTEVLFEMRDQERY